MKASGWFRGTRLGDMCTSETHCKSCKSDGDCDQCWTIDGRDMEVVSDYASTCDWCGELKLHENQEMDPQTQLGYCSDCLPKIPPDVRKRIKEASL